MKNRKKEIERKIKKEKRKMKKAKKKKRKMKKKKGKNERKKKKKGWKNKHFTDSNSRIENHYTGYFTSKLTQL